MIRYITRNQTVTFRVALFVASGAITFLATTQQQDHPVLRDISDKTTHFLAFYALALLVDFSFPKSGMGFSKVVALLTYGLLIEVIQGFLPHRTASLLDLFADGVGIALYKLSLSLVKRLPFLDLRWRV
jgi:VanZ family protein